MSFFKVRIKILHEPNNKLMMIQRHVVELGLDKDNTRIQSLTMHNIGEAEDEEWKTIATFIDTIQLTLRGKTVQVGQSLLHAIIISGLNFRSTYI